MTNNTLNQRIILQNLMRQGCHWLSNQWQCKEKEEEQEEEEVK